MKEVELPDLESAVRAVSLGWEQRASASNGLNVESSRSHAVLCVKLLTHKPGSDKPSATRLCIVDLAGAERQKKTGMTTQTNGTRLNEAMSINKDLMVLGHCLRDLRYNQLHPKTTQKVPPFRDSRITMLFRDYLSGNGQISVIAAISPRAQDAVGTLDTLKFAAIAQQVKIVEKPKPVERNPVNLPRVAGGAGSRTQRRRRMRSPRTSSARSRRRRSLPVLRAATSTRRSRRRMASCASRSPRFRSGCSLRRLRMSPSSAPSARRLRTR